ncbi:hypothetical protein LX36DRAFT_181406 [Colletotrichum falcatum]|nr:hypothetical protein LX36DRAFT_181406 [Colletotrichum falcatum]
MPRLTMHHPSPSFFRRVPLIRRRVFKSMYSPSMADGDEHDSARPEAGAPSHQPKPFSKKMSVRAPDTMCNLHKTGVFWGGGATTGTWTLVYRTNYIPRGRDGNSMAEATWLAQAQGSQPSSHRASPPKCVTNPSVCDSSPRTPRPVWPLGYGRGPTPGGPIPRSARGG